MWRQTNTNPVQVTSSAAFLLHRRKFASVVTHAPLYIVSSGNDVDT
jgi:hypothetical protein